MSSKAEKKAAKMRAKNALVRRLFALPKSEVVVQNYRCSLHVRLPFVRRAHALHCRP